MSESEREQLEICRWIADLRIVLGLTRVVLEDLQALRAAETTIQEMEVA